MPQDRPARPRRDRVGSRSPESSTPGGRADQPSAKARLVSCIEVARAKDTVLFRVIGLGSVNNAGTLWDFAERSMIEGWHRFAIDLSECMGLDSTFLGTLVGLSQEIGERVQALEGRPGGAPQPSSDAEADTETDGETDGEAETNGSGRGGKGWVTVLNCSEANRELFEIVGADRFVRFRSIAEMEPIETEPLAGEAPSLEKRLQLVRRSHQHQKVIDRRNEERFGAFLERLAAELAGDA